MAPLLRGMVGNDRSACLELMPPLRRLVPPATVIDKTRYSAFFGPALLRHLHTRQADSLIVTGSQTEVCVSATIMAAVDDGFRVIRVRNGVCSSSDEGHIALLQLYHRQRADRNRQRRGNSGHLGLKGGPVRASSGP
jgi:nicotinamidase-related amidase